MRGIRFLMVAAVLCLAVPLGAAAQSAQQVWQDTLTIGAVDEPQTFDPAVNVTQIGGQRLYPNLYQGLVQYDAAGRVRASLATAWTISGDGLVYTFTLRPGVRFSDGTAFDAPAVKFAFDRLRAINKGPAGVFDQISRVDAVSPSVVRFTLSGPFAPFLSALGSWQGALFVSPKLVQDNAGGDFGQRYMNNHTAGTGPYMLQSWQPENEIVLVRNPYYWGRYAPGGVQRVVFRTVREPATGAQLLLRGDVDILEQLVPQFVETLKNTTGVVVQSDVSLGGTYALNMHFNSRRPPFTDVRVRQGLSYAVDYGRIIQQVYGRLARQARGPLPSAFQPWFDKDAFQYTLDLSKARALLRDAGLAGKSYHMTLGWQAGDPVQQDVGQIVKENLAQVGFDIDLQEMPLPVWREAIWKNNFDLIFVQFSLAYADPDARLWRAYHSSEFKNLGFNPGWTNKQFDQLLEQARTDSRLSVREHLYDEAQVLVTQEAPTVFLAEPLYSFAYREAVRGIVWIPAYGPFFAAAGLQKSPGGYPH